MRGGDVVELSRSSSFRRCGSAIFSFLVLLSLPFLAFTTSHDILLRSQLSPQPNVNVRHEHAGCACSGTACGRATWCIARYAAYVLRTISRRYASSTPRDDDTLPRRGAPHCVCSAGRTAGASRVRDVGSMHNARTGRKTNWHPTSARDSPSARASCISRPTTTTHLHHFICSICTCSPRSSRSPGSRVVLASM